MTVRALDKRRARTALSLPEKASVVLWLGRLSVYTKLDPWPTYAILERVAKRLNHPLVLLECGPDDKPSQEPAFIALRKCCPNVHFKRMGGAEPVSEELKRQALAAADLALSLVDNTQETFGLAVAEAMAAGLPVVASNWNGYRDLFDTVWMAISFQAAGHQRLQQFHLAWVGNSFLESRVFQSWLEPWLSWFSLMLMRLKRLWSLSSPVLRFFSAWGDLLRHALWSCFQSMW